MCRKKYAEITECHLQNGDVASGYSQCTETWLVKTNPELISGCTTLAAGKSLKQYNEVRRNVHSRWQEWVSIWFIDVGSGLGPHLLIQVSCSAWWIYAGSMPGPPTYPLGGDFALSQGGYINSRVIRFLFLPVYVLHGLVLRSSYMGNW